MLLYVTAWHHEDVPPPGHTSDAEDEEGGKRVELTSNVIAFCKRPGDAQTSVAVRVQTTPFFFVRTPSSFLVDDLKDEFEKRGLVDNLSGAVMRKSLWGYQSQPSRFAQLAFQSQRDMRIAAAILRRRGLETFESCVDPVAKLLHSRELPSVGWISVPDDAPRAHDPITRADLELVVQPSQVAPAEAPADDARAPVVVVSWDLECYSESRRFPNALTDEDCIVQIATSFSVLGQPETLETVVFCLRETAAVPGVDIRCFESEVEMIEAWVDELHRRRVDLLIGYNTDGFDWCYLLGRQQVLVDDEGDEMLRLDGLGRMVRGGGVRVEKDLNSAAYGQNKFVTVSTPGVTKMDLLTYARREFKLESYSLNAVSAKFLGDNKIDLPAHKIFDLWESGGPEGRAQIAEYAAKDTALPIRLLEKLRIFTNTAELANACSIPIDAILMRGQQIRVFSCVVRTARRMGFAVPDDRSIVPEGKFDGAFVLDPVTGAHTEPVCTLDFASLYPSIIRAQNLSWDTLVLDEQPGEGVEADAIDTSLGTYHWVQGAKGVLPTLLEELAGMRKAAKRDLARAKAEGNEFLAALLDARQLAVKVVMNSAYGFTGASKGYLPCVPIAICTTTTGRNMIMQTKRLAEELVPGSTVVYGDTDSVFVKLGLPPGSPLEAHFEKAAWLAAEISKTFRAPNELEFEKVYHPLVLIGKKRYFGLKRDSLTDKPKIDTKGLQLVRRDSVPLVRTVSSGVMDAFLYNNSVEAALEAARSAVRDLVFDRVPFEQLVLSKQLRGSYANPASQPHLTVANKRKERTGEAVPSGSRVRFVYLRAPHLMDELLAKRAEDPDYALEHGMKLDITYYLHNQMLTPLLTLLDPLVPNAREALLGEADIAARIKELEGELAADTKVALRKKTNTRNRQREITAFFQALPQKRPAPSS